MPALDQFAPPPDSPELPVVARTLPNGLRVVVQPDPSVPIVGLAVFYDIGSRNEVPGRSGFAHLFEHMMFQGSANVPKAEHFRYVQAWGGQVNGTTSQDRTNYYESLPSHQLGLGLWLEADRMRSLAVTPENFENQRQTVMEERRQRVDDAPYGQASIALGELSFSCWAYAHPVIGSWEDLEQARFEDVTDFHQRWYRPDNAVLAIAGDVDLDAALGQIEQLFGDIPAGGERPTPDLTEPRRAGPRDERLVDRLVQLPGVFINHQAPDTDDDDFYVYELIETLLLRGPSSRIYRRLVVDEQLAVQLSGGYEAHRGPSLFSLFAVCSGEDKLAEVVSAWQQELDRLARERVPTDELEKALNQLRASHVFGQESALGRALGLGRSVLFHGDPWWEQRYLDRVARIGADDVLRVARRDFGADGRVTLAVVPG